MTLHIELTRAVTVRCYEFVGTVSMTEPRPEIHAVLLALQEHGGEASVDQVARHLLPSGFEAAASRLVRICLVYGLVEGDRPVRLSDKGREAIAAERVPVPCEGAWVVWLADDPLLPHPVLRLEAAEPRRAEAERRDAQDRRRRGANAEPTTPAPRILRTLTGRPLAPIAGGKELLIDNLGDEVLEGGPSSELRLAWTADRGGRTAVRLSGTLTGRPVSAALPAPPIPFDDLWEELLQRSEGAGCWDRPAERLRVPFPGDLDAPAILSMHLNLQFEKPSLQRFGEFDPLDVAAVPITCEDARAAQLWSIRRLMEGVSDYQTTSRFAAALAEAVEPFAAYEPRLPDRRHFAAWAAKEPRSNNRPPAPRFWHLQAPLDWDL
jgi:hypothetical protein